MGEAKNRTEKQTAQNKIDAQRAFRAHIAEQLAALYQRRSGILESRLNTEATIAKFKEGIRPENAIGSQAIARLAHDLARSLECAQTCCDMAIDDLSEVWNDAQPLNLLAPFVPPPPPRAASGTLPRQVFGHDIENVPPQVCSTCRFGDVKPNGSRLCKTRPRPIGCNGSEPAGCQNYAEADTPELPNTHSIPRNE